MGSSGIVVEAGSGPLRRVLSATAWVVLEEVALGAESTGDGRLVAATSARQVAAGLAIDAGTAAGALRQLRRRGILTLERQPGPGGRFGLSTYSLTTPPGLIVLHPCGPVPHVEIPHAVTAVTAVRPVRSSGRMPGSDHPALNLGWSDS